jgi:PAS domain S-box-containing protein
MMSAISLPPHLEQELEDLRREVTELRAAQARHQETCAGLEALEVQLAGIIHSAMDGIITIDDQYRVVLFNAAAEQIFRCPAREALGQTLDQFIPVALRDAHRAHIQEFSNSGEINRRMNPYREVRGVRMTGEEFPLEASISQVERSGKKWFTVILRDVTLRKIQEDHIAQLGKILDDSINEVYVFESVALRFSLVNQSGRDNSGYSLEELAHMTLLEVETELSRDAFEKLVTPLKEGATRKIEFQTIHRRKDGTTYPVEAHVQYLSQDGQGLFVAIMVDLTKQTKTEIQLREARRTLSTLLTNLPGMVYRCRHDADWSMDFVSPSCLALTGYTDEAFKAREVSFGKQVILPEDLEKVQRTVDEALQNRRPFQLSYRIRTAEGSVKWVWEQGCAIFDEAGELQALEGYIIDVTQERLLEDQLRKAERLAELGTLASGMAHEIGTPMNVILGRAELLMRKAPDESTRKGLQAIVTQVERITKIMHQLLSFARKRPAERRAVNLSQVVADVLDVLQEKLKKYRIQVELRIPSSLPAVWADSDQMNQVLLNLIINACQAMPDGGTLTLTLQQSGHDVQMIIKDSGCGIPEDQVGKIFDPFFTTKPVGEGTGLGLTVVHGIVQEHDGFIQVVSAPDQGTTFIVALPVGNGGRFAME